MDYIHKTKHKSINPMATYGLEFGCINKDSPSLPVHRHFKWSPHVSNFWYHHLHLSLPGGLLHSGFPDPTFFRSNASSSHMTQSAHLILYLLTFTTTILLLYDSLFPFYTWFSNLPILFMEPIKIFLGPSFQIIQVFCLSPYSSLTLLHHIRVLVRL